MKGKLSYNNIYSYHRENLSSSNLNNLSFCLKSESFTENFLRIESNSKQEGNNVHSEIKSLREKFNSMLDTMKKSANRQELVLNKFNNNSENDSITERKDTKQSMFDISISSSMLREEQPLKLDNILSNNYEAFLGKEEEEVSIQNNNINDHGYHPKFAKNNKLHNSILDIKEDLILDDNQIDNFYYESI